MDEEDIKLADFIRSDFDYDAYCKKIEQNAKLTPEEKAFAKDILNPDSALMDVKQRILRYKREQPTLFDEIDVSAANTYVELNSSSYPAFHNMAQEVWEKTKQHYHKEIATYNSLFRPSENEYPNSKPELLLLRTSLIQAGACFSDDGIPQIAVSKGFLEKLPADEQQAIIFHECSHLMEPILAQMKPEDYAKKASAENESTQNAFMRSNEFKADLLAATLSDGDALLRALTKTEELYAGFEQSFDLKRRYEDVVMSSIYHAAHTSSFGVDEEKRNRLSKDTVFWVDALNDEIMVGAKTPVQHKTTVEAPTHPTMDERSQNIRLWQKRSVQSTSDTPWTAALGDKSDRIR